MPAGRKDISSGRAGKDGIVFMEINRFGRLNAVTSAYAGNKCGTAEKKERAGSAKNTDKAVFSSSSGTGALAGAKANAARAAESFASPERIAALKAMIADGSYNISAESVAASILEG